LTANLFPWKQELAPFGRLAVLLGSVALYVTVSLLPGLNSRVYRGSLSQLESKKLIAH
jgi:hypothetical protein